MGAKEMLESERFAVAARLHVALRRITGRVTDTEWLAKNHEYANEIAKFARKSSHDFQNLELSALAEKLEDAMGLVVRGGEPKRSVFGASRDAKDEVTLPGKPSDRYVGGLR
jgi:uncharacterized protein YgfB (UPF0149 family)